MRRLYVLKQLIVDDGWWTLIIGVFFEALYLYNIAR